MRAKPVTEFKRRKRRPKVKFKVEDINYKNVELLKNFMNDKGKISPARVTGLEAKIQRKIAKAIKRSRQIALMPYTKIEKYLYIYLFVSLSAEAFLFIVDKPLQGGFPYIKS